MELLSSIWQIDKIISEELSNRKDNSYESELTRLLEKYREILKQYSQDGKRSIYQDEYIFKYMKKIIPKIKKLADLYLKGNIIDFNKVSLSLFNAQSNNETASAWFPTTTIRKDSLWYRARKPDLVKRFVREELFHVPFQERGKASSDRFSLPGYPCLYLGKSLKCVDVETGVSGIKAVSCFKLLQDIETYDFTFFSPEDQNDNKRLIKNLMTYPFKIASSIQTIDDEKHKDEGFKAEYIIPQLLLHCVIKQRGTGGNIKGILYSSTKDISNQIDAPILYNLVVPTTFNREKGYCSNLNTYFSITEPEIVPFPYFDEKSVQFIQQEMGKKQFSQIDIDYDTSKK